MTASLPIPGAMGYWPISAIPTRTRTMPSEPCAPRSHIVAAVARLRTARGTAALGSHWHRDGLGGCERRRWCNPVGAGVVGQDTEPSGAPANDRGAGTWLSDLPTARAAFSAISLNRGSRGQATSRASPGRCVALAVLRDEFRGKPLRGVARDRSDRSRRAG